MSFQQGLSGLAASSQALDVVSNNIANAGTVGFKSANAQFADVYARSLAGAGASQVGIGTTVASIQQQFTQGNLETTNNPLDIAINGNGFFRMSQNGSISYTRNGQFHLDSNGYIVNAQSQRLTGYPADATGNIVPSTPVDLQLSSADQAPIATGANTAGSFQGVQANLNFDSRVTTPTTAWSTNVVPATGSWAPNAGTYNYSTALSVYDSLGNAHTLTMYMVQSGTAGQWNVYANVDGATLGTTAANATVSLNGGAPNTPATLTFNSSGALQSPTSMSVAINWANVATDLGKTNNALTPQTFNVNFNGSTQFGSSFSTNSLQQDGYAAGHLTGLSVSSDGVIQGNYSNGQTRDLGQVVMANFTNPNGLASVGGNQWTETAASGQPLVGAPNTGSLGVLQSSAVEDSNVDLTSQLVSLITQQRNYQANAQSIKTQSTIMQTLVNLPA